MRSETSRINNLILTENMDETTTDERSPWVKAPVANLVRYKPSGIYFSHAKVGGKLIRRSLKTEVLSIAKLRLRDLLAGEHQRAGRQKAVAAGKMTFSDAVNIYKQRLDQDAEIKPRTKKYQAEILEAVQRAWPEIDSLDMKKVTQAEGPDWRSRFGAKYSATRVNWAISLLRRAFQIAVDSGIRHDNPVQVVRRAKVRGKQLTLLEAGQFLAFVTEIENSGSRHSKPCVNLVRFLAYGGFRITEAGNITWGDCDFFRNKITVRGDPETGTKNGEIREVPMIPEMQTLLGRLRTGRQSEAPDAPVMLVREGQKAMNRAAEVVGMARITHHNLRHLFATRCIESGVDIPTVSRWLGQKDGGALAMRVYGLLRDAHSVDMAKKFRFSDAGAASPATAPTEPVA